jgi:mannose-6-phosphate isomerase-like protein (cupin superfamily)
MVGSMTRAYRAGMVQPGDVIDNPVTGERMTFLRTSAQTGGALAEIELQLSPAAFLAAEHIHRSQEERFDILQGTVLLRCSGKESTYGPAETVAVPAGASHAWAPVGGHGARIRLTFTPGADIEDFFDEFFRLARNGMTNDRGMLKPLDAARLGLAHDMYLGRPPVPIPAQRAAFRVLVGAARLLHRSEEQA